MPLKQLKILASLSNSVYDHALTVSLNLLLGVLIFLLSQTVSITHKSHLGDFDLHTLLACVINCMCAAYLYSSGVVSFTVTALLPSSKLSVQPSLHSKRNTWVSTAMCG